MNTDRASLTRQVTRLRVARFRQRHREEILRNRRENMDESDAATHNDEAHETSEDNALRGAEAPYVDYPDGANDFRDDQSENNSDANTNISDATDESNHDRMVNSETSGGSDAEENPIPILEEDSDDDEGRSTEIQELREWACTMKIPQTHLNSLLRILRRRLLPDLPKTATTFLRTNEVEYDIRTIRDRDNQDVGTFVYFGMRVFLLQTVNVGAHEEHVLDLLFNIDGLPLFKSSSMQFWPILCKVYFQPDIYKPFPVAIYAGTEKPPNLPEFFEEFIREINQLLQNGIEIEGQLFQVRIKNFICDRPARSFIKCITGHGGYYACERCTDHGERNERRTIYPAIDAPRRTNDSFRDQENSQHHNGLSPLLSIEPAIDMVKQFSLDFMHLCCLGIMKKMLLEFWLDGKRTTFIGQNNKGRLTNSLKLLSSQVPEEFQRTTRSLDLIKRWKATEFRFFLLYIGPIVLKTVLPPQLYRHFLLFHAACRILCCNEWAFEYNTQARQCLRNFFQIAAQLYGARCQIMNMHSLIHLADDVTNMNCSLTEITAFPFENALGKLKSMIRSGNRPLAQVCRRMQESFYSDYPQASLPPDLEILSASRERADGSQPIKKLRYKGYIFSERSPNNVILLRNGKILQIENIYREVNEDLIKLQGFVLRIKRSIFEYPCDSASLNMWRVRKTHISKTCTIESIDRKMLILDLSDEAGQKLYAISLLHSR